MATIKEITPVSYQTSETLRKEQNSFVRFIDQNKELFDRHSFLTYELRDEEEGWRNSSTVDQMVNSYTDLTRSSLPNIAKKQLSKVADNIRRNILRVLLSSPDEIDDLIKKQSRNALLLMRRLTNEQVSAVEALYDAMAEFNRDFCEAKAPVAAEVQRSKTELSSKFKNYILSDPDSIFAFRDFLLDKNYASNREVIRPFLASFTQSEDRLMKDGKGGILSETVKKQVGEISEKATPDLLDEFVASIKSPNILEWLKFAAQGEDIANSLTRSDFSAWPSELRKEFKSFVASKYHSASGVIRNELAQFRKPLTLKGLTQQYDFLGGKAETVTAKAAIGKKPDNQKGTLGKTERKKHTVGILSKEIGRSNSIRPMGKEEMEAFLQKEAFRLDPADPRMLGDLKRIIADLLESPYGLGIKKLSDMFIGVENKSLPIRSINPGKRIGLQLEHPESQRVRITYVIYKNGEKPVIGIDGILTHDDYDRKYA